MIEELLAQESFAVIGVSPNTQKYGWIVYQDLKSRGRRVYAVNQGVRGADGRIGAYRPVQACSATDQ